MLHYLEDEYYEERTPKYRKKKEKKKVKKSNHKHIWKAYKIENYHNYWLEEENNIPYIVTYIKKCIVCGKEKVIYETSNSIASIVKLKEEVDSWDDELLNIAGE